MKKAIITEEGQERLLAIIRKHFPELGEDKQILMLWSKTGSPYVEYRVAKDRLLRFINKTKKGV